MAGITEKMYGNQGGGSGGDSHNKGSFLTPAALREAYPTAEPGDFAIVESTDTVWVWDNDGSDWKDADQKGQVTSVNNQTGAVTLDINDIAPTQTGKSGYVLGTDGFVAGWVKPEIVQVSALPAASEDEVDNIYQFVGTTDANYTNGYFYKCVSDGATPAVYSWTAIEVQAGGGLPSQTGNAGKFLTTDGTDASWGTTISEPLSVINTANADTASLTLGNGADSTRYFKIIPSYVSQNVSLYFGLDLVGSFNKFSFIPGNSIYGFRIGSTISKITYIYAEHINNGGDITVPTVAGEMAVQVSTVPTADSTLEGKIYQYIGATDANYTNGYFYKCVSDGQTPATYSWAEVQLGGGGSSYTAGTGIDITSGVISTAVPMANLYTNTTAPSVETDNSVAIGQNARAVKVFGGGLNNVAVGDSSYSAGRAATAIGKSADARTCSVSIGCASYASNCSVSVGNGVRVENGGVIIGSVVSGTITGTGSTFSVVLGKVINYQTVTQKYELLNYDGTIPTDRLTKVNSTITLTAADWSSNTQTVNVTGMTADGVVMVSPDPTDQSAYTSAGILCTAQAAGTLTFTCDTVPSGDLSVNVVML